VRSGWSGDQLSHDRAPAALGVMVTLVSDSIVLSRCPINDSRTSVAMGIVSRLILHCVTTLTFSRRASKSNVGTLVAPTTQSASSRWQEN